MDKRNQKTVPTLPQWKSKRQQPETVKNRFLGCLLGGAVGDAMGAPVEFLSRSEILRQFGTKGQPATLKHTAASGKSPTTHR
jgi:ADP-ribosylglycohydrolase